ncbi:MAG: hypothetical protein ACI30R_09380 [Sodaliphilus sp.]
MSNECVVEERCRGFIKEFDTFVEIWNDCANFHDATLAGIDFCDEHDACIVRFRCDTYIVALKFSRVHAIFTDIPDFRSSFFYDVSFYVKPHCDYGQCIIMETTGDLVKVIAEEMEVVEYKDV